MGTVLRFQWIAPEVSCFVSSLRYINCENTSLYFGQFFYISNWVDGTLSLLLIVLLYNYSFAV